VDSVGEDWDHPQVDLSFISHCGTLDDAVSFLFPRNILTDPLLALKRAFLSPINMYVQEFNEKILNILPGFESKPFLLLSVYKALY